MGFIHLALWAIGISMFAAGFSSFVAWYYTFVAWYSADGFLRLSLGILRWTLGILRLSLGILRLPLVIIHLSLGFLHLVLWACSCRLVFYVLRWVFYRWFFTLVSAVVKLGRLSMGILHGALFVWRLVFLRLSWVAEVAGVHLEQIARGPTMCSYWRR